MLGVCIIVIRDFMSDDTVSLGQGKSHDCSRPVNRTVTQADRAQLKMASKLWVQWCGILQRRTKTIRKEAQEINRARASVSKFILVNSPQQVSSAMYSYSQLYAGPELEKKIPGICRKSFSLPMGWKLGHTLSERLDSLSV